jgi:hypothetical protein
LHPRHTADGDKTRFVTQEEENRVLRLENAELKIEQDIWATVRRAGLFRGAWSAMD